jgi:hypothetical protein
MPEREGFVGCRNCSSPASLVAAPSTPEMGRQGGRGGGASHPPWWGRGGRYWSGWQGVGPLSVGGELLSRQGLAAN